jgi:hypothetical protein
MATVPWAVHWVHSECTGLHWVHWVHWAAAGALARAGDEGSVGNREGAEERVTQRVLSEDSLSR